MHKRLINVFLSAFIFAFLAFSSGTYAFAAEASDNNKISRGFVILILIAIFIVTTVIAGFVSFKLKKKSLKGADKSIPDKAKDQ